MTRWPRIAALTVCALGAMGAAALAQEPADPVRQFAAAEAALDEMKYRHLWLAYAAIWLLIMALVARTAKRQAALAKDLQAISARVDEMEKTRE
jgi:heme exporter protein D